MDETKLVLVYGNDINTGEFVGYLVRKCHSKTCEFPASVVLAWERDDVHYCLTCARKMIEVGRVMNHYLPEKTARLMTKSEMLMQDDIALSVGKLEAIRDKNALIVTLWGNEGDSSE